VALAAGPRSPWVCPCRSSCGTKPPGQGTQAQEPTPTPLSAFAFAVAVAVAVPVPIVPPSPPRCTAGVPPAGVGRPVARRARLRSSLHAPSWRARPDLSTTPSIGEEDSPWHADRSAWPHRSVSATAAEERWRSKFSGPLSGPLTGGTPGVYHVRSWEDCCDRSERSSSTQSPEGSSHSSSDRASELSKQGSHLGAGSGGLTAWEQRAVPVWQGGLTAWHGGRPGGRWW